MPAKSSFPERGQHGQAGRFGGHRRALLPLGKRTLMQCHRMKVQQFLLLKVCDQKPLQSGKPELQTLEGTLERKQKLQLGGKKVRKDSTWR